MGGRPIAEFTAWTSASDLKICAGIFEPTVTNLSGVSTCERALTAANGKLKTIRMDSQQPVVDLSTDFR